MRKFVWQDDAASEHCTICRREFNFFNRRHHCRECGTLVCDGCSNQRAEIWDAEKRWYSPQRVCDPCAQRRSGEVVIGTRALGSSNHPFGRPASDTTSTSGGTEISSKSLKVAPEASVIYITVRAVTGLLLVRPSALWGGPASAKKPWHLCCALSVDGKPLGATTVKKWVASTEDTSKVKNSKTQVTEKAAKEGETSDTTLEWNETFSFRLGAVRPFKAAEYVIVELKDKRASGVLSGSSDDTVAYLRLPVSGLTPGENRKGWCSLLGPVPHAPPTDGSLVPLAPPGDASRDSSQNSDKSGVSSGSSNSHVSDNSNRSPVTGKIRPLPAPVLSVGTGPVRPFISSISTSVSDVHSSSSNSQGAGGGNSSSIGPGGGSGYTGEYIRRSAPQRRSLRGRLWVEVRCERPAAAPAPATLPTWTSAVKEGNATATATAALVTEPPLSKVIDGATSSTLPPEISSVDVDTGAASAPTNQNEGGISLAEKERVQTKQNKLRSESTVGTTSSSAPAEIPPAANHKLAAEQPLKALCRRRPRLRLEAWGLLRADTHYPTMPLPANSHLPWTWQIPPCASTHPCSDSPSSSLSVHRNQRGRLLGFHLGPLRLWYPPSHPLHKCLFRRVGPLPEDVVPRHEHALEVVPFVQLRLHAASRDASLSSGCLVLTTHRVLFFPEDYTSENAKQRNYSGASEGDYEQQSSNDRGSSSSGGKSNRRSSKNKGCKKDSAYAQPLSVPLAAVAGTILRRRWRDIQGQTALELICIDARHFVFVFQGSDAAAAVAWASDGTAAPVSATASKHESTASDSAPSTDTMEKFMAQAVAGNKDVSKTTGAEEESEMPTRSYAQENWGSIDAGFMREGSTSRQGAFRKPVNLRTANSHASEETAEWWGYEGERRLAWMQEQVQWLVEEDAFADGAKPKHIALRDDFSDEEDDAKKADSSLQTNSEGSRSSSVHKAEVQKDAEGTDPNDEEVVGEVQDGAAIPLPPRRRRFGSLGGFERGNSTGRSRNHTSSSTGGAFHAELNAESDPPLVLPREALAEAVNFEPPTSMTPSSSDENAASYVTPASAATEAASSSPPRSKSAARQAVRSSFAAASTAATALTKFRRRRSGSATAAAAAAVAKSAETAAATTEVAATPEAALALDIVTAAIPGKIVAAPDTTVTEVESATEAVTEVTLITDKEAAEIGAANEAVTDVAGGTAETVTAEVATADSAPCMADPLPDRNPPSSGSSSSVPRAGLPSHGRILMRARPGAKVPEGARLSPVKGAAPNPTAAAPDSGGGGGGLGADIAPSPSAAAAALSTIYSPAMHGEAKVGDDEETPSKSQPLFLSPSAPALTTWEVVSPSPETAASLPPLPPPWWRVLEEKARVNAAATSTNAVSPSSSLAAYPSSYEGKAADLDMLAELKRLGIGPAGGWANNKQWRVTNRNQNFGLCPTYPRFLVVPTAFAPSGAFGSATSSDDSYSSAPTAAVAASGKVDTGPSSSEVGTTAADGSIPPSTSTSQSANLPPQPPPPLKVLQRPSSLTSRQEPRSSAELLSDSFLDTAAPWRSLRRFPVLTWLNPRTGAPLLRCAQPKVGFAGGACLEDEALLMALRPATRPPTTTLQVSRDGVPQRQHSSSAGLYGQIPSSLGAAASTDTSTVLASSSPENASQTYEVPSDVALSDQSAPQDEDNDEATSCLTSESRHSSCVLRIIDARPLLNAKANAAMGKGHESIPRLGGDALASLTFANIANIHAMRESYVSLRSACALAVACKVAWNAPLNLTRFSSSGSSSSSGRSSNSSSSSSRSVLDQAVVDHTEKGQQLEESNEILKDAPPNDETLQSEESERETATGTVVDSTLSAMVTGSEMVLGTAAAAATAVVKPTTATLSAAAGSASVLKGATSSSSSSSSSTSTSGNFLGQQQPSAQMTSPHLGAPYWFLGVVDSKWFNHLSAVLLAARLVATHSEQGDPVVVHCSDGWDRTAQVVSLAQFLLDPYYRTIEGFQVLVEKDWNSFGHQFAHRCHGGGSGSGGGGLHKEGSGGGGGKEGGGGDEAGPVFVQWLDCVWQVLQQFPTSVEFSADLLLLLADASYSRWWSNFRDSSDAERATSLAAQVDADAAARAVFEEEIGTGDASTSSDDHEAAPKPSDSTSTTTNSSSTYVSSSNSANLPPVGSGSAQKGTEHTTQAKVSGQFTSHRASVWEHVSCCKSSFTNVLYRPPPGMASDHQSKATASSASEPSSGSSNSSNHNESKASSSPNTGQVLWPNPTVGALELWHALHVGGGGGPLHPTPSREDLLAEAAQRQAKRASALKALLVEKGLEGEMAELLGGLEDSEDEVGCVDSSW